MPATLLHIAVTDFAHWRELARPLLRQNVPPQEVVWADAEEGQETLAGLFEKPVAVPSAPLESTATVPRTFLVAAEHVALHREARRWSLLYRVLYRLTHGGRHLMEIVVDPDIRDLLMMEKAVTRDMHKMKAFVRFRRMEQDGVENYIAWHRPDHRIVQATAPFFVRRFGPMHWAILTPDASAYWDTQELRFGPGVPASEAPPEDALEDLWRTYYASVFNPARVKVKAMKQELPVRHWPTLPEALLIPGLLREAERRVATMKESQPPSAANFLPVLPTIESMREAAVTCEGCDLFRHATQTVFGEGPPQADIVFVGEAPGDEDDLKGRPFSGPAGRLLDRAMEEAGLDRQGIYITNTVKHFKFELRGKRRIHKTPGGTEINACRPWLEAELTAIQPKILVALGATAAAALVGRTVTISKERGVFQQHRFAPDFLITMHPSAVLRTQEPEAQEREYQRLVLDLKRVKERLINNS